MKGTIAVTLKACVFTSCLCDSVFIIEEIIDYVKVRKLISQYTQYTVTMTSGCGGWKISREVILGSTMHRLVEIKVMCVIIQGRRIIVYASAAVPLRTLHPLGPILQRIMIYHFK